MNRTHPYLLLLSFAFISISFTSCINTKKVVYFNDVKDSARIASMEGLEPVIQKNDLLSISVSSLSAEATAIFNGANFSATPATTSSSITSGYIVGQDGTINFPVLGNIAVQGSTKKQVENNIEKLLLDKKLLYNPIVTIRFLNFRVTVLGEVVRPGVINVPTEQISILEAIGQAGDLTIYGVRENIMLIRQVGAEKQVTRLNLNSSSILQSPYYYLKSNDVVYVEPGKAKAAIGERSQQLLPIVLSGLSLLVVIITSLTK